MFRTGRPIDPARGITRGRAVTTVRRQGSDVGVARLSAPVLRYLADNPEAQPTESELAALGGVEAGEAQRLAERLQRAGVLVESTAEGERRYLLAPAREQRRRRARP